MSVNIFRVVLFALFCMCVVDSTAQESHRGMNRINLGVIQDSRLVHTSPGTIWYVAERRGTGDENLWFLEANYFRSDFSAGFFGPMTIDGLQIMQPQEHLVSWQVEGNIFGGLYIAYLTKTTGQNPVYSLNFQYLTPQGVLWTERVRIVSVRDYQIKERNGELYIVYTFLNFEKHPFARLVKLNPVGELTFPENLADRVPFHGFVPESLTRLDGVGMTVATYEIVPTPDFGQGETRRRHHIFYFTQPNQTILNFSFKDGDLSENSDGMTIKTVRSGNQLVTYSRLGSKVSYQRLRVADGSTRYSFDMLIRPEGTIPYNLEAVVSEESTGRTMALVRYLNAGVLRAGLFIENNGAMNFHPIDIPNLLRTAIPFRNNDQKLWLVSATDDTFSDLLISQYDIQHKRIDFQQPIPYMLEGGIPAGNGFAFTIPQFPNHDYLFYIDRNGYPGFNHPELTVLRDVPNDQGMRLWAAWEHSGLQAWRPDKTWEFMIFRGYTESMSKSGPSYSEDAFWERMRSGEATEGDIFELQSVFGPQGVAWEWVNTVPASPSDGLLLYQSQGHIVPTLADSAFGITPVTHVQIWLRSSSVDQQGKIYWEYWQSNTRSAWSVDNVPPYAPPHFQATVSETLARFSWSAVNVDDLATYELRQGRDSDFMQSFQTLSTTADTVASVDIAYLTEPYLWVVATDRNGNVSSPSEILASSTLTTLEASIDIPMTVSLQSAYPNPFNPGTMLRYGIPESGHVRLEVYNMLGQRVAILINSEQQAGWHTVQFDADHLASGTYIARITSSGITQSRQMSLIK